MYSHVVSFLSGALMFLMGLAIFSRLVKMPMTPQLIKNATAALTNLFNGAFDK